MSRDIGGMSASVAAGASMAAASVAPTAVSAASASGIDQLASPVNVLYQYGYPCSFHPCTHGDAAAGVAGVDSTIAPGV